MMGLEKFEPYLSASPWAGVALIGLLVAGRIIVVCVALRGAEPKDRPHIIKAVAELFRWFGRTSRDNHDDGHRVGPGDRS